MTLPESKSFPRRRFLLGGFLSGLAGLALPWRVTEAQADAAGTDQYIGDIMLISWNFPPRNWALCNGQLLPVNQNQALFSLLGTTYGGNGVTNFALPDLRACVPIHQGQGPGLTSRNRGERGGEQNHTVTSAEMPAHTHQARAASLTGTVVDPSTSVVPARNPAGIPQWGTDTSVAMNSGAITTVGGGLGHSNLQPYLVLNYVIALAGIYPS